MTSVSIRDAVMGDAGQIAELITELGYPTTPEAMRDRLALILADPRYATFVADRGGSVLGVAGCALGRYYEKDGLYSQLVVLAVSSSARGEGIGARLVETIEAWSSSKGARDVIVNSGLHRVDAHRFYERCGYSRTGFRFVKQLGGAG
jgi:GNAT superfamily N-acetyltransferase